MTMCPDGPPCLFLTGRFLLGAGVRGAELGVQWKWAYPQRSGPMAAEVPAQREGVECELNKLPLL